MAKRQRNSFWLVVLTAAAALLCGCAGSSGTLSAAAAPAPQSSAPGSVVESRQRQQPRHAGEHIARIARGLVGAPYRYGGADPHEGFDCSGLVFFTHRQLRLSVPRTSAGQYRAARPVSIQQALPGDLVFFSDQNKPSHVGIYLGSGRFVHAPSSGRRVSVERLDAPYYASHLVGLGRLY